MVLTPICWLACAAASSLAEEGPRHSYLVLGSKTAIIDEDGAVLWTFEDGTRDGFVLPNGHVLLAYRDRVVEVQPSRDIVFAYRLHPDNREIGTAQRLDNGRTLITELGPRPRLLEVDRSGEVQVEVPLEPETDNAHMQTRMARQLKNGNYLVPHLLAFCLKEYRPDGQIVRLIRTDLPAIGGRPAENWPFTAIRLDNGHTLVSLTHGNRVVEFDPQGAIAWQLSNEDVGGLLQDPCGVQRLANGNTVIGSHAAKVGVSMIEVTPDKRLVWSSDHPLAARVHHFQILSTNGRAEPGLPRK
jgi:hypothetical protein